jgi:hypothetical protein
MAQLEFTSQFNKIYILESLNDDENKTGTKLTHDLKSRCLFEKLGIESRQIKNKSAYIDYLEDIKNDCERKNNKIYPLLHLEIHGLDDQSGLIIKPSQEIITWNEFTNYCRKINKACGNNLIIVMAVCYGYHAISDIKIRQGVSPYYALIGPSNIIYNNNLNIKFLKFYEKLFTSNDVLSAYKLIENEYCIYHCEDLFIKVMLSYFRDSCIGEGKKIRIDRLLERYIRESNNIKINVKQIRKELEEKIKPTEQIFERYKKTFLLSDIKSNADRFKIDYNQILSLLN